MRKVTSKKNQGINEKANIIVLVFLVFVFLAIHLVPMVIYDNSMRWKTDGNTIYIGEEGTVQEYSSRNDMNFIEDDFVLLKKFQKEKYQKARNAEKIEIVGKVAAVDDMSYMFSGLENVKSIKGLNNINTSEVTDMNHLFSGCRNLKGIGKTNWDVNNTSDMSYMFSGCENLKKFNASGWEPFYPKHGTDFLYLQGMFQGCTNLKKVKGLDVVMVKDTRDMFKDCKSLEKINVSKWDMKYATDIKDMFKGCSNLKSVDISNWDLYRYDKKFRMKDLFKGCKKLSVGAMEEPYFIKWKCDKGLYFK